MRGCVEPRLLAMRMRGCVEPRLLAMRMRGGVEPARNRMFMLVRS